MGMYRSNLILTKNHHNIVGLFRSVFLFGNHTNIYFAQALFALADELSELMDGNRFPCLQTFGKLKQNKSIFFLLHNKDIVGSNFLIFWNESSTK